MKTHDTSEWLDPDELGDDDDGPLVIRSAAERDADEMDRARTLIASITEAIAAGTASVAITSGLLNRGIYLLRARNDEALKRLLFDLRSVHGCAGAVDRAVKEIDQEAKLLLDDARRGARAHVRIAHEDETSDLRGAIGAPKDWPTYAIPSGWHAVPDGVFRLVAGPEGQVRAVLVADEPLLVLGSRVDAVTDTESLVLGFRRHGRWNTCAMPRAHARSAREIVGYAGVGLPVSSGTAKDLVAWIVACESSGRTQIPVSRVTSRLGWHGDVFVAGPGGPIALDDPRGTRAGWTPGGTWEGWRRTFALGKDEPVFCSVVFAACVGPILRFLDLKHNPIVDVSGPSGRGKTTTLRGAGSVYGRPDELPGGTLRTWEATATALERTAADTWDAVLLIDDSQRAQRPEAVGGMLYALAQGQGRARGTPGGMQVTATWRLIAISSGESSVTVHTEAGGARRRVLSFTTSPQIRGGRVLADQLTAGFSEHYGHLAPRLAAKALELGAAHLRERFESFRAVWNDSAPGADGRLVATAAVIEVAAEVALACGVPAPMCAWRDEIVRAVAASIRLADQGGRALDVVRDEIAQHAAQYHGREAKIPLKDAPDRTLVPSQGYRGTWGIGGSFVGIFPEVLRELLTKAGHDFEPVVKRWVEEKVLKVYAGKPHFRYRVKIEQVPTWVYAFHFDKLDLPAIDESEEPS